MAKRGVSIWKKAMQEPGFLSVFTDVIRGWVKAIGSWLQRPDRSLDPDPEDIFTHLLRTLCGSVSTKAPLPVWLVWPVPLKNPNLSRPQDFQRLMPRNVVSQNHQRLASISQTLLPNGTTGWLYLFLQTVALEPVGNDRGSLAAASEAPEIEGAIEWAWRRLWTCTDKPKACWQNPHTYIYT